MREIQKADYRDYIVFIFAASYAIAEHYARVHLNDRQGFTFIDHPIMLKGLRGIHYIKLPGWSRKDDAEQIDQELKLIGAIDISGQLPNAV